MSVLFSISPRAMRPRGSDDYDPDDYSSYKVWEDLVRRVERNSDEAMEELYHLFCRGIRFHICRHLAPQDIDDKLHDTFVIVVQAIKRGDIREPMRLMGFVRTVVRRMIATHIEKSVEQRREYNTANYYTRFEDRSDPEQKMMFQQRNEILGKVLAEMSPRDRDILTRFYIREQSAEQICKDLDMNISQFRLLKSRAKVRFGELGKKKLAARETQPETARAAAAGAGA